MTACIAGVTATQVELPPTIVPTPIIQPTPTYVVTHQPQVQGIEIQMIGSDPVQVNAIAHGTDVAYTPDSTYHVVAHITADGPTSAYYEISSPAGNFRISPDGGLSTYVTGTLVFDQAGTKEMGWGFVGPYPDARLE